MRFKTVLSLAVAGVLVVPSAASANFLHVVTPGESLASVAATDGLSVAQLAATNGISPAMGLVTGATLAIPPRGTASASVVGAGSVPVRSYWARVLGSSAASGSYVVRPGDTLSAIAARAGTTVGALAVENGLNPRSVLVSGTVLRLGGGGRTVTPVASVSQPVGRVAQGSPSAPPYTTAERVTASQVASIAAANGVPPSLAAAIGWQESGYNNALTSSADARGVMQILPGTWQWINSSLTRMPLSPSSAADNVRGGVLLLHSLLQSTGGSQSMAAAGYYQGLPSVRRHGLFPSTQRYVSNVMSLASLFGGG
jgi:LysM repeat protein